MAELAALEMLCTGNRTVGSNPTLSAILDLNNWIFDLTFPLQADPRLGRYGLSARNDAGTRKERDEWNAR